MVRALGDIEDVDVFGRLTGNVVSFKGDVAYRYRFMLCAENDLYPGYVTEKVFDAWALGCVPIWAGVDREGYLNKKAVINAVDFAGPDELVDHIRRLDASREMRDAIINEPLLNRPPQIDAVLSDLAELLAK